jgi:hypothetical protein
LSTFPTLNKDVERDCAGPKGNIGDCNKELFMVKLFWEACLVQLNGGVKDWESWRG